MELTRSRISARFPVLDRRRQKLWGCALAGLMLAPCGMQAQEKAPEDPTKIATKLGIGYTDEVAISGSLAFGPVTKVNARISENGHWSLGASYLFPFAIVTFSAAKTEFDDDSVQTRYSIGGFVPLTQMGVQTGKWHLFVPFGYSHTESERSGYDLILNDTIVLEQSSQSGYVGVFGFRPLSETLTLMGSGVVSRGGDDFSGVAISGGLSYHLTAKDTVAVFANYVDNSFGEKRRLGISYRHEF